MCSKPARHYVVLYMFYCVLFFDVKFKFPPGNKLGLKSVLITVNTHSEPYVFLSLPRIVRPMTPLKTTQYMGVVFHAFLASALHGDEWSGARTGHFTPG